MVKYRPMTYLMKRIFLQSLIDIFYFPIWWYSKGTIKVLHALHEQFDHVSVKLAVGIWLRNLFVPMFGQTDWQGRLMSIFMRLVNVFFRSFALAIYVIALMLISITWVILPVFLLSFFILSLTS